MPMAAGTVRVYQSDSTGGVQFVGEDRIEHTPKDEVLNLKIGTAFDVVCERKQVDFQKTGANGYEIEYAITLRNHNDAHHSRSERTRRRRHLAHAAVHPQVDQDSGLCRAVHGACGSRGGGSAEVSDSSKWVSAV